MDNRCGKCDELLIALETGEFSCPVCDPPIIAQKIANQTLDSESASSKPSPADPPNLNQTASSESATPEQLSGQDKTLLPPTASSSIEAPPISEPPISNVPIANVPVRKPPITEPDVAPPIIEPVLKSTIAENERVLLPDGKGGFIETSERTTHIEYRGSKIALSSMKRDEREASRGLKNFMVVTFCVVFLLILMFVLSWLQSPTTS